jgi:hypothetical protein
VIGAWNRLVGQASSLSKLRNDWQDARRHLIIVFFAINFENSYCDTVTLLVSSPSRSIFLRLSVRL